MYKAIVTTKPIAFRPFVVGGAAEAVGDLQG